jgi:O-antigen/teichoic acid export membrane protein
MSLVVVLMTGLSLLSDVAIQPCVIQSRRGDDPRFLDTAFTIQAMRGVFLALLMLVLARPAAWFYREPSLAPLIAFSALQLFFGGLHSTAVFTLRRELRLGWVNGLELGQTLIAMSITIALARAHKSAWPLVFGMTAASFAFSLATHFLPVPYRNHFRWDRQAAREISQFGRWVLGSTAATFLGAQADRILLGRFLGVTWLGVYSIALTLSEAAGAIVGRLVNGVMYPVLSDAARTAEPTVGVLYYRLRTRFDLIAMVGTGLLGGAGGWLIRTLWDARYTEASWMLRILCVRVAISLLVSPGETCLFSLGHTRFGFQRSVVRLVGAMILLPLGWRLGGIHGLVWGTVATELTTVFAVWPKLRSLAILRYRRELGAIALFAAALIAGAALDPLLPRIHLR